MKRIIAVAIVVTLFCSVGCSKKIDGTTEETFKNSIQSMGASMNDEERTKFTAALMYLTYEGAMKNMGKSLLAPGLNDKFTDEIRNELHGKSASEIIRIVDAKRQESERIRLEREAKEKEENERLAASMKAKRDLLKKVLATNANLYKVQNSFITEPGLDVTITNNLDFTISRVYARGVLQTPGREVPWLDKEFNFTVEGGLEPGEKRRFNLRPNMFSSWSDQDTRGHKSEFTVIVLNVDNAKKEKFISYEEEKAEQKLTGKVKGLF